MSRRTHLATLLIAFLSFSPSTFANEYAPQYLQTGPADGQTCIYGSCSGGAASSTADAGTSAGSSAAGNAGGAAMNLDDCKVASKFTSSFMCTTFGFDCVDYIRCAKAKTPVTNAATGGVFANSKGQAASANQCAGIAEKTRLACFAPLNPGIANAMMWVQGGLSGLRTLAGTKAVCTKMGEISKNVETAMMAYNTACGGAAAICTATCLNSVKTMASLAKVRAEEAAAVGAANPALATMLKAESADNQIASAEAKLMSTACLKYTKNLISVGIGIATNKMQAHLADECRKGSEATAVAAVDCSNPTEAANNIACICQANPRAAGCPAMNTNIDVARANGANADSSSNNITDPNLKAHKPEDMQARGSGAPGGSGSGNAPGSFGGASSGGGQDGGTANNKLKSGSGLDANILAGEWGGGGGRRGGGGGSADPAFAKYQEYMPGGAKAASGRDLASDPYAGQVSGAGGKSNFDKIRDRYVEAGSTLNTR